jgi:hypothetical protein
MTATVLPRRGYYTYLENLGLNMKRVSVLRKAPAEGGNLRETSVVFICVLLAEGGT